MDTATHTITNIDGLVTLTVAGDMMDSVAMLTPAFNVVLECTEAVVIDIREVTALGIGGVALIMGVSRNKQAVLRCNVEQAPLMKLLRFGNAPKEGFGAWWTIVVG